MWLRVEPERWLGNFKRSSTVNGNLKFVPFGAVNGNKNCL